MMMMMIIIVMMMMMMMKLYTETKLLLDNLLFTILVCPTLLMPILPNN